MPRIFDVYLLCVCLAGIGLVGGFTAARDVPPDWVLALALAAIVLTTVGVVAGIWQR